MNENVSWYSYKGFGKARRMSIAHYEIRIFRE